MSRKTLGICLVVSVLVNLVVIGFLLGQHTIQPSLGDVSGISHMLRPLEEEQIKKLLRELKPSFQKLRGVYPEVRKAQRDVYLTATAPEYDAKGFEQALNQFNALRDKARDENDRALVLTLSKLSEAERKRVIEYVAFSERSKQPRLEPWDRRVPAENRPRLQDRK